MKEKATSRSILVLFNSESPKTQADDALRSYRIKKVNDIESTIIHFYNE